MFVPVVVGPFEISAEIPRHRLAEKIEHGDEPFFVVKGCSYDVALLFAVPRWLVYFASSHNQNTSQGYKPESFLKKFLFSF